MAKKDKVNAHDLSIEELKKTLTETRKELTKLRLDHVRGQLKNSQMLTTTRRKIAQTLTVIREKELAALSQSK